MKTFKVGDRVTWVRKGNIARYEGMDGVRVTGTVIEIDYTTARTPRLVVKGDFKTAANGHVLTFKQAEHTTEKPPRIMTQEQKQTAGTVSHILRFLADCIDSLSGEGKYPLDFAKLHLLTHRDNDHRALVIGRGQIDELLEDVS